jgi:predicted nucleotide-binding protein
LKSIGLDPVVLHRQPDEGRTILEKFEHHSDVGYAFVLLTPDEVAFLASELELPEVDRNVERRARPNVIFEFGYFVGRLGRSRVCCIYKGDVALPSDIGGLVYKKVADSVESIGFSLVKELRVAGYPISL